MEGKKKKKDKLPQGRQQPVCLTRAGERGGIKMGAQWEAGWGRSERREQQRRGKWVGNHEKCHFWGTLEGRSSERSARCPPREEKSTGMRTSRSLFVLQHGRRERQRTRRRFRGDAANTASTDAAELAKVSLTSRLPFTSCQIKRWRGSGGLEAKRGIQSAFRCERKKDTSEPGRVNVLFVPPLLPVLLSLCRLCWHKLERPSHGSVGGAAIQLRGPKLHKAHLQIFPPWCH